MRISATKVLDGTGFKPLGGIGEKGPNGNAVNRRSDQADIVPPCLEPCRDRCPNLQKQDGCGRFCRADMRQVGMARKHDIGACGYQIAQYGLRVMYVGGGAVGCWHRGVVHQP
jgi:hypothetical protein